jgi:hypothetical protein
MVALAAMLLIPALRARSASASPSAVDASAAAAAYFMNVYIVAGCCGPVAAAAAAAQKCWIIKATPTASRMPHSAPLMRARRYSLPHLSYSLPSAISPILRSLSLWAAKMTLTRSRDQRKVYWHRTGITEHESRYLILQ